MGITSRLAALSPFGHKEHGDDMGEVLAPSSDVLGLTDSAEGDVDLDLRLSPVLRKFVADNGILSAADAGVDGPEDAVPSPALQNFLTRSHTHIPASATDRSFPLTDYYISSSHNTYLLANQLYGTSCPSGYTLALKAGARCVEIDAWDNPDNKDEPKVTHGYTLVSNIPFRTVCDTLRDAVDEGWGHPAPLFLSLENHCGEYGQRRLVEIMKEVWGDRLLSAALRDGPSHANLSELQSKICVMVEYHFANEPEDDKESVDCSSDSDSESAKATAAAEAADSKKYNAEKKAAAQKSKTIIPELAAIGVYAQSIKPPVETWFDSLENPPHHHLMNVSESGLGKHLPTKREKIAEHNSRHLMRVYPRGTRIRSSNLPPVPFWGIGAQVCALNWQRFGASMQLNHAMFNGTSGYVLKPAYLREGGPPAPTGRKRLRLRVVGGPPAPTGRKRLRLRVVGATDAPAATAPYVSCVLVHPNDLSNNPPKRKTGKDRKENVNPVWDEILEWEYDATDLAFLRILLKSDEKMARNPVLSVVALRLLYAVPGWNVMRMYDLSGNKTKTSLLVNIEVTDIE